MNFCFSKNPERKITFSLPQTDIFCFFYSPNSVFVPSELWFSAVVTSLRLKQNVLILETFTEEKVELNTKLRWQVNDSSLWLAPRSLSVLLEATKEKSIGYSSLKNDLKFIK